MDNRTQTFSRPGGLGLRSRLALGIIGLLAILLAVGVESITLLDRLGSSIDVVSAARRMAVMLLLGTAFAGICIAFLFRSVLVPLERLTRATRLADAARDLDGALLPVRKTLEVLKAEPTPLTPSQEDLLDSVRQETDRLGQVAQNLLALSRGEESRPRLHFEPVAPRDLIEDAVSAAAGSAASRRVTLATEVNRGAPLVLADRKRTDQVFSVLLQNALAHTAAGGSVIVRAEPDGDRTRFSVSDQGSGIPPAYLERIFEPFYQIPGTEDLGGVGLGLAIARDIVQTQDGEIRCDSAGEGRGATFWFTLPAAGEGERT